jgi:hypothetical protein
MFTILFILSVGLGLVIAWIGWFGQGDHDKGRGRNDR